MLRAAVLAGLAVAASACSVNGGCYACLGVCQKQYGMDNYCCDGSSCCCYSTGGACNRNAQCQSNDCPANEGNANKTHPQTCHAPDARVSTETVPFKTATVTATPDKVVTLTKATATGDPKKAEAPLPGLLPPSCDLAGGCSGCADVCETLYSDSNYCCDGGQCCCYATAGSCNRASCQANYCNAGGLNGTKALLTNSV